MDQDIRLLITMGMDQGVRLPAKVQLTTHNEKFRIAFQIAPSGLVLRLVAMMDRRKYITDFVRDLSTGKRQSVTDRSIVDPSIFSEIKRRKYPVPSTTNVTIRSLSSAVFSYN